MKQIEVLTTSSEPARREVPTWLTYFVVISATLGAAGSLDGSGRVSLLKLAVALAIAISFPVVVSALGPKTGGIWSLCMSLMLVAVTFSTLVFIDDGADLNAWAEYAQGVALFAIVAASSPVVVGRAWVVAALMTAAGLVGEAMLGLRYTQEGSFDQYLAARGITATWVQVFFGNPNNLAAFSFLSCLGLLLVILRDPSGRWRGLATIAMVTSFVAIALTGSRLAFVATMILALSLGIVAFGSSRVRLRQVFLATAVGAVVLAIPLTGGSATLGAAKLETFLRTELGKLFTGDTGTSGGSRVRLAQGGFEEITHHWYSGLGSGAGSFESAIAAQQDPELFREGGLQVVNAHNLLLETAVEVGLLVAIGLGAAWLVTVFREGGRMMRSRDMLAAAAFGTMAGSALISGLPSSLIGFPPGWLFIGTYVAIRRPGSPYRWPAPARDRVAQPDPADERSVR